MGEQRNYIGFATLPEQIHRKSIKKGFEFTLMIAGESGLGKSTLVNSLFLTDLYKDRKILNVEDKIEKTMTIDRKIMEFEEKGVRLRLTVVDTPGFGDALDCTDSYCSCVNYIDDQFRQYFQDENGINRKNIQDNRVNCCIYFVSPYGHGLRQLDIEFLRRLHNKVNILPVISKCDALTADEIKRLKMKILQDVEENKIKIYHFPDYDSDEEDQEFLKQEKELKESIPFAVASSNTIIETVDGKKIKGRQYPWGIVEVENPKHSEFLKLKTILISTHMQDLKEITHEVHYEAYRAMCIKQMANAPGTGGGDGNGPILLGATAPPTSRTGTESRSRRESGNNKMDDETERLLQEKDEQIRKMQSMLNRMQEQLKSTSPAASGPGSHKPTIPPRPAL